MVGITNHVNIELEPVPLDGNSVVKKFAETEGHWEEEAPLKEGVFKK